MTDARERLADLLKHPNQMYRPASLRQADADAILAALRLTPEAAAALMDGAAVVVPREPTDEQCEAAHQRLDGQWSDLKVAVKSPSIRDHHRAMVESSPYRSNSNG